MNYISPEPLATSSTSPVGGGLAIVAGSAVEPRPGWTPVTQLPSAPFVAVLVARPDALETDIARLRKAGAARIVPLNCFDDNLDAALPEAIASALIAAPTKYPSARLLKAAIASAAPMRTIDLFASAGPMVDAMAHLSGSAVEFAAGSVLAAVSGLIAGRFSSMVRPGWEVAPILWVALVGDASSGKSPIMDLAMKPIRRLENADDAIHAAAVAAARAEEDKKAMKAALAAIPPARRAMVSNVTVEALQHVAAEQGRGMLGFYDELSEWFGSLLKYNRSASGDRGTWLAAHNGYPLTVDRRSLDAPLRIPFWGVSLLGGIPPSVLSTLATGKELNSGDGLDARLLYIRPNLPPLELRPNPEDASAEETWARIVDRLWQWRNQAAPCRAIPFSDEAREVFEGWRLDILARARATGREVSPWIGKAPGLVARLALVMCCLDAALEGREVEEIELDHVERAAALVDTLGQHRRRAELERGAPAVEQLAAEVGAFIIEHQLSQLNTYELRRGLIAGIRTESTLRAVLVELHAAGWITTYVTGRKDELIPPQIQIDPRVHMLTV
jgi:hypothetical protein